jgi:hypothetical protein
MPEGKGTEINSFDRQRFLAGAPTLLSRAIDGHFERFPMVGRYTGE